MMMYNEHCQKYEICIYLIYIYMVTPPQNPPPSFFNALVPLLQTCQHFGPWLTKVLDHIDNTLRVAQACHGAWAVGSSQVTFFVRTGRRARRAVRRGTPQPLDLPLLAELGFFPPELLATLQRPNTFFWLSRSVRLCETFHGHLEVEELEGLVEYTGFLHVFWVLQITTLARLCPGIP